MKNTQKIAYCGIFSALATVLLVVGAYSGFGFTAGFLASVCVVANAIAYPKGVVRCFVCFVVSAVVSCWLAPVYLQILPYIFIFAPLCLSKLWVDKGSISNIAKWAIKIAVFEVFFVAYLAVYRFLFADAWDEIFLDKQWLIAVVLILGQVAFVVYQFALNYVFAWLGAVLAKLTRKN